MKMTFVTLLLCLNFLQIKGQILIETDSLKFWQSNLNLNNSDFKGDTTTANALKWKEKINLLASSGVSVVRFLDIPKKKKNRGKMLEKAYFVPCWRKHQSYTFTTDSFEIEKQKLYFDIAEMICRMARKDIDSLQNTSKAYGMLYFTYVDIANHYCEKFGEFHREYTQAVFVRKEEKAYKLWRDTTHAKLKELDKYATTQIDCQRVITNIPVDKEYILSPTIYGQLKKCN
jgi:hypothetical protein